MSDAKGKNTPYEQGELKPSPEAPKRKKSSKKSKKSHKLPPEAKYHTRNDDDDDVQIIEAGDHGEEEGGSLTIKPPQAQASRHKERVHKHKKEKHRSRDSSLHKEKARPEKPSSFHRGWKPKEAPYPQRDAREIVRERKKERAQKEKEIAREMKEREARKREESIKESQITNFTNRERLERMELERRRDRQIREEKPPPPPPRPVKRKEDRGHFVDRQDKGRKEDKMPTDHHRSRSRDMPRDQGQGRYFPPPPRLQEDRISKRDSKKKTSRSPSKSPVPRSEEERYRQHNPDHDTRMVVVEEKDDYARVSNKSADEGPDRKRGTEVAVSTKSESQEADGDEEENVGEEESDDSESDSDDSESDSSSEDDSSDEGEEEDEAEEKTDNSGRTQADSSKRDVKVDESSTKLRSKFDDHSDVESGGGHSDSDHYMPDSPVLSDVELRPEDLLPPYYPAIQGCRSVEEFNCLNRIEEGTYGVVYRAEDKKTAEIVALKRLKMEKEKEGFPITSLREINTLLKAQHENIVTVREIVVGSNMDKIYIVMDFVEHDLKSLMESMKNPFLVGEVKTLLRQLLEAVHHLHENWILHRDLKTSNLLLSHRGILKVGDFGLAREFGSPLRQYTPVVVTLWYRAPELLLGCKKYSTHVDMWSVGCIFAEFLLMKALWPGKSEIDQLNRIFKDLGTPTESIWPGMSELPGCKKMTFNTNHVYNVVRSRFGTYFTDLGFDLMNKLFTYDPSKRITAEDAKQHKYFGESPLPVDPSMFPTWPARSEGRKHASSPKPPSGGKAYQKLLDDEESFAAAGFHMPSSAKGASAGVGFSLKF